MSTQTHHHHITNEITHQLKTCKTITQINYLISRIGLQLGTGAIQLGYSEQLDINLTIYMQKLKLTETSEVIS